MGPIRITRMQETDLKAVLAIERAVFTTPWSRAFFLQELRDNSFAHLFVARTDHVLEGADDQVVGYACLWIVADEAHITNIATHEQYRQQSVARRLMMRLIEEARRHHCIHASLEVRPSNKAALKLYEQFGFGIVVRRKRYYEDSGEDALILWREGLTE